MVPSTAKTNNFLSRRGRPKKLDQKLIDKIIYTFESSKSRSWEQLAREFGIGDVHWQTLRNRVVNEGYCKSMGCHMLWLTMEARNARLSFATSYYAWRSEWRSVIFISHAEVELKENQASRVHVDKEQKYCFQCLQKRKSKRAKLFQCWVMVGFNRTPKLAFVPEKETSGVKEQPSPRRIHREHSIPHQQSPKHVVLDEGATTPQFFDGSYENGAEIIRLPPNSPELNIGQDVLSYLKNKIQKRTHGSTDNREFAEAQNISIRCVNKLVDSMFSRIATVIAREGKPI
ncbi:hypothetical protein NUU61_001469 [Penicillium alfredii]|uniref:Tc1-like transposase DDE domain-containing protein n=1 Tax=Penicillium alfredii TaxID=1506179 RepID=A0A9W9KM40_9EURO|nr:uncharacterized protein NUU61_001469 [Penicillium alfredii]KAJ5111839.1 hypothetical protein NUU61_001469 [Penicillium alfredii]